MKPRARRAKRRRADLLFKKKKAYICFFMYKDTHTHTRYETSRWLFVQNSGCQGVGEFCYVLMVCEMSENDERKFVGVKHVGGFL